LGVRVSLASEKEFGSFPSFLFSTRPGVGVMICDGDYLFFQQELTILTNLRIIDFNSEGSPLPEDKFGGK